MEDGQSHPEGASQHGSAIEEATIAVSTVLFALLPTFCIYATMSPLFSHQSFPTYCVLIPCPLSVLLITNFQTCLLPKMLAAAVHLTRASATFPRKALRSSSNKP